MLLTIRNLSDDEITAHQQPTPSKFGLKQARNATGTSPDSEVQLPVAGVASTVLGKGFRREIVLKQAGDHKVPKVESSALNQQPAKEWHIHPEGLKIRLSLGLAASWKPVQVPDDCPWKLYIRKIDKKHHMLVILNRRSMASFLADMPDKAPLSALSLPGTHESMAFYGWPISQCQSTSTLLSTQLNDGIRVVDIRLAVIPSPGPNATTLDPNVQYTLMTYHGIWPEQTNFLSVLADLQSFLSSPLGARETIVMSLKQEDFAKTPAPLFSQLVHKVIIEGPGGWDNSKPSTTGVNRGMWFLENRIPLLGEVRGKVVLLSRFGGNGSGWDQGLEGLGIHPTTWPDSQKSGFEWELKGTTVRTHDWYAIPSFFSIPEKFQLASQNLVAPNGEKPTLSITYFSGASIPLALPPVVAKGFAFPSWGLGVEGMNARLGSFLLEKLGGPPPASLQEKQADEEKGGKDLTETTGAEPRIRGWTMLDFYSEPKNANLIPLLVECNYRGRKMGEEGW